MITQHYRSKYDRKQQAKHRKLHGEKKRSKTEHLFRTERRVDDWYSRDQRRRKRAGVTTK